MSTGLFKRNGQWDDEAVNYIIKHGPFESREDFELAQKEDPRLLGRECSKL